MPKGNSKQDLVYAEQLRLMYAAIPLSVVATITNSLLMIIVLWSAVDHGYLIVWGTSICLVMVARSILTFYYRRHNTNFSLHAWGRFFTTGALLTALTWACAAIFLFPTESIVHQAFLAFIFAGMTAGSVTTLSYMRLPAALYILLMLVPLAVQFFFVGERMALAMGTMIVMYLIIILSSMKRFYENSHTNIELRFDAVHREKALQESQSKYENIFHSAPLGIAHFDHEGTIIDCNEVFCRLANCAHDELVGSKSLMKKMAAALIQSNQQTLIENLKRHETDASLIGGEEKVSIRAFIRSLEQTNETVMIVEDISKEKRVERLKDEFVSNVSHELRTPLTAINGSIGLIASGVAGEIPDKVRELSKIAAANTQQLLFLIDDILDLGKIESDEIVLDIQQIILNKWLADNVESNKFYKKELGVKLSLTKNQQEITINADESRLNQVLSNLLSNAVKFSEEGTVVSITLSQVEDNAMIEVTDQGPGIPESFQSKIFDRFTQNDGSSTRSKGGTGLGLSITQALVKQMGGKIGFETESGKGTTFYVTFPCINPV